MIQPATHNIAAQRWSPFKYTVDLVGYDFTGGTFAMDVRSYRDAPGSALISLANATAGLQGISVAVVTTEGVPTSTLTIQIDESTLEALQPFTVTSGVPNRKAGSDLILTYDIHLTGAGFIKSRWFQGSFTIAAGVTQ